MCLAPNPLPAQSNAGFGGSAPLTLETPAPVRLKPGATGTATLRLRLAKGYHTNSSKPADEYLIPFKLTWDAAIAPFEAGPATYPEGKLEKYDFSEKPVSVYSDQFAVSAGIKAPAAGQAKAGQHTLNGKIRYQACTNTTCFAPRTLPVQLTVIVE